MIYIIHETGSPFYKIGYTGRDDVSKRAKALQTGNPRNLRLVAAIHGSRGTYKMEQYIHGRLDQCRVGRHTREWYDLSRQADAIKIIQDTFDITVKATYDAEKFAEFAEAEYNKLKQVNEIGVENKSLKRICTRNGDTAMPGAVKKLSEWSNGKDSIVLMSRGFSMAQFITGEDFDRHIDDNVCLASMLMSQGFSRADAIMCVFHVQTLIAQGHPRMKKIWNIGKHFVHTSIDNMMELYLLCKDVRQVMLSTIQTEREPRLRNERMKFFLYYNPVSNLYRLGYRRKGTYTRPGRVNGPRGSIIIATAWGELDSMNEVLDDFTGCNLSREWHDLLNSEEGKAIVYTFFGISLEDGVAVNAVKRQEAEKMTDEQHIAIFEQRMEALKDNGNQWISPPSHTPLQSPL